MFERLLQHRVAAQPHVCGECRAFYIPTVPAFDEFNKGYPICGECRRYAPCPDPIRPMYPRVMSDAKACLDALGALVGAKYGPLA